MSYTTQLRGSTFHSGELYNTTEWWYFHSCELNNITEWWYFHSRELYNTTELTHELSDVRNDVTGTPLGGCGSNSGDGGSGPKG